MNWPGFALKLPPRALEIASFLVVGGLNACFGYGVFSLMVYLGFRPAIALLIATVLGICFNFLTYGKMVFRQLSWRRAPTYLLVYSGNYLGNAALLVWIGRYIHSPYIAQLAILPLSVTFLYFALRQLVFRTPA
jgi:putative flippase GtrA